MNQDKNIIPLDRVKWNKGKVISRTFEGIYLGLYKNDLAKVKFEGHQKIYIVRVAELEKV